MTTTRFITLAGSPTGATWKRILNPNFDSVATTDFSGSFGYPVTIAANDDAVVMGGEITPDLVGSVNVMARSTDGVTFAGLASMNDGVGLLTGLNPKVSSIRYMPTSDDFVCAGLVLQPGLPVATTSLNGVTIETSFDHGATWTNPGGTAGSVEVVPGFYISQLVIDFFYDPWEFTIEPAFADYGVPLYCGIYVGPFFTDEGAAGFPAVYNGPNGLPPTSGLPWVNTNEDVDGWGGFDMGVTRLGVGGGGGNAFEFISVGSPPTYYLTLFDGSWLLAVLPTIVYEPVGVAYIVWNGSYWMFMLATADTVGNVEHMEVFTSTDPMTGWTSTADVTISPTRDDGQASGLAYGDGAWVATMNNLDTGGSAAYRSIDDGVTWTLVHTPLDKGIITSCTYGMDQFFICGVALNPGGWVVGTTGQLGASTNWALGSTP